MAGETRAIEVWMMARLSGDADLQGVTVGGALITGIYNQVAEQGAAMPYVIFAPEVGEGDRQENSLSRSIAVQYRHYSVQIVGRDCGFEALEAARDRFHALLHKAEQMVTDPRFGVEMIGDIREEVPQPGIGGESHYYRGGLFRFIVQPED